MFNIQLADELNQSLLEDLTKNIAEKMQPLIDQNIKHDETVSKAYLRSNVFHCGNDRIDEIVNMDGFPKMLLGDSENYVFSLKAVDEWIAHNQIKN